MKNKIKKIIIKYNTKIGKKTNFSNIFNDLDSLQYVELLTIIEKQLKKKVNFVKVINEKKITIDNLLKFVK
jgi:acyl carrier protein